MYCLDIRRIVSKDADLLKKIKKKKIEGKHPIILWMFLFFKSTKFPKLKQENNSK